MIEPESPAPTAAVPTTIGIVSVLLLSAFCFGCFRDGGEFTLRIDYALLRPAPLQPGRMLEVTVNGERYSAAFDGAHAAIPLRVRKERLHSSVVPVVIRREKSFSRSDVLLERVEIR